MQRTLIKNIKPNEEVFIECFVEKIRNQKTMQFIILRDISGKIQLTVEKEKLSEIAGIFETLVPESVVSVFGKACAAPQVKLGGIEIIPSKVEVLSSSLPSPLNETSSPEQKLDYRWIDLRDPKNILIFKVRTTAEHGMREWAYENGFMEIHTPHITAFSSEGGSEVFEIKDYFGQKAYLTQSSQLFKQCAMAAGFEKTIEIGPCFRSNPSFTSRHATEFIQADMEISFIKSHHDVMDIEEAWIKHFTKKIEEKHAAEIKELFGIDFKAPTEKFPRITLADAYKLLEELKGYKVPKTAKGDLDPDGERLICEIAKEKYGSEYVFITDFPASVRAFYSMKHDDNPLLTKSFDLLYKGQEITSGAQREHRTEVLKKQIAEKGINPKDMEFYTQFFDYGCPPHGGLGFGTARFFAKLFDLPSIKESTFLFRGPSRLKP